jgi:iron-sulfur cluster assembly protein
MKGAFKMTEVKDRQKIDESMLYITHAARDRFLDVAKNAAGVRMYIKSAGCGDGKYKFDLVEQGREDAGDLYYDLGQGKKLFIPTMDFFGKLMNSTIDFVEDDLGNRHIQVENPNEKGRCGCGESVVFGKPEV